MLHTDFELIKSKFVPVKKTKRNLDAKTNPNSSIIFVLKYAINELYNFEKEPKLYLKKLSF